MKRACHATIGFAAQATMLVAIAAVVVPVLVLAGLAYLERAVCSSD